MGFGIVQKSWHLAEKCPSRFSEDQDSQNRNFSLKSLFMLGFWCLTPQNVPPDKLHWYLMPNNQVFIEKVKKSLKNNFGFLKNSHRPLKIGGAARQPRNFFPKKIFQIDRLTILGKVMASWCLFKAPFKLYREKTSVGGGVGNHPPGSSRVKVWAIWVMVCFPKNSSPSRHLLKFSWPLPEVSDHWSGLGNPLLWQTSVQATSPNSSFSTSSLQQYCP